MSAKLLHLIHIIPLLLFFNNGRAQSLVSGNNQLATDINRISTAVPFLTIAPDARSLSLGETGVASKPDAYSIYWNAAKNSFSESKYSLGVSYAPWMKSLVKGNFLSSLSGHYKLKNDRSIGASFRYFSHSEVTYIDLTTKGTYEIKPKEFALDISYSMKLSSNLSGAATFKYIQSNLASATNGGNLPFENGKSIAVDLSLFYQKKEFKIKGKASEFLAGLSINNIGPKIKYSPSSSNFLPSNLRLGASLNAELDEYNEITFFVEANKLLVPTPPIYSRGKDGFPLVDGNGDYVVERGKNPDRGFVNALLGSFNDAPGGGKEEIQEIIFNNGLEYLYNKQFALRAGYIYEHKDKGNRSIATVGFGFITGKFLFDFAYMTPIQKSIDVNKTNGLILSIAYKH